MTDYDGRYSVKVACTEYDGVSPARYAHVKYDGHYMRIVKENTGAVRAYSSQDIALDLSKHPKLLANVSKYVPGAVTLLGELHVEGQKSSAVKTCILNGDPALQLIFFAVQTYPAEWSLECVDDILTAWGLRFADYKVLEDGWNPTDLISEAQQLNLEGWVLKDGNLSNWRKLKVERTIDLVIFGYIPGNGKYVGKVGSVMCASAEGHKLCSAAGFTDAEREYVTANQKAMLGTVVEVKYQYVGAGGKLRHARVLRFRDDKRAEECGIFQDAELLEFYE